MPLAGANVKVPAFGLTGGIATGKSTVASYLELLGARIIDADRVGHEMLNPGSPGYPHIISAFGQEILGPRAGIDRKRLAALVFGDPRKLETLNAILHPLILMRVLEMAQQARKQNPSGVTVVEAALIYEAGIETSFLGVIATWCRPEQQLERLLAKDQISREEAQARLAAQLPAGDKRQRADFAIDCSTSIESTRAQVELLFPKLQRLAAEAAARFH
jgi:dephospho-CoA kinase